VAVVDGHTIKRLSFASEELAEGWRIVAKRSVEQNRNREVGLRQATRS
jgi:hypothetical protein